MTDFSVTVKATLLRDLLKAHIVCASKDVTRPYINGVAIMMDAPHVVMVSTDGHRLLMSKTSDAQCSETGEHRTHIIPVESCKSILSAIKAANVPKGMTDMEATLEHANKKWALTLFGMRTEHRGDVNEVFPPYKQVIPDHSACEEPCRAIGIEASYVADAADAFLPMPNGARGIKMTWGGEFDAVRFDADRPHLKLEQTYVVMPMRI